MLLHAGTTAGASRIEFGDTYLNAASQTIYTFANCDFADAEPSRLAVVVAYAGVTPAAATDIYFEAVSIGGVAADYYVYHDRTDLALEVWVAVLPEGTMADVVVECSQAVSKCEIATLSFYNMDANTYAYPTSVSTTSFTMPLFENGGALVAVPGVQTLTGMDNYVSGTNLTVGWKLATAKATAHPYTISTATSFAAPYGGLSLGP